MPGPEHLAWLEGTGGGRRRDVRLVPERHVTDRSKRGPTRRWSTGSSWPLSDAAPRGGPAERPRRDEDVGTHAAGGR